MNAFTRLATCRVEGRMEVRLRFGGPICVRRLRGEMAHYWFTAGALFAVTWWTRTSPRKQFVNQPARERGGEP